MEKDTRSMLEWTRDIWKKHLHVLPVHKDFPRLSCGLEIVDGDSNRIVGFFYSIQLSSVLTLSEVI